MQDAAAATWHTDRGSALHANPHTLSGVVAKRQPLVGVRDSTSRAHTPTCCAVASGTALVCFPAQQPCKLHAVLTAASVRGWHWPCLHVCCRLERDDPPPRANQHPTPCPHRQIDAWCIAHPAMSSSLPAQGLYCACAVHMPHTAQAVHANCPAAEPNQLLPQLLHPPPRRSLTSLSSS